MQGSPSPPHPSSPLPPRDRDPSAPHAHSAPRAPCPPIEPARARTTHPAPRWNKSHRLCARCPPGAPALPEAGPRRRRADTARTSRIASPLVSLAALLAAAPVAVIAGPVQTARPTPRSTHPSATRSSGAAIAATEELDTHAARTGGPTARPRRRERAVLAVLPRYSFSDGDWVEDFGWTLRGKGTEQPTPTADSNADEGRLSAEALDTAAADEQQARYRTSLAAAMADSVPSPTTSLAPTPTTLSSTATDSAGATGVATQPSASATGARPRAAAASVSIPSGWRAKPRETDYYAVPIIVAMSVLVALIVVISIVISVLVRRKKRRRSRRRQGEVADEAKGEKGWRGVVEKMKSTRARKGKKRARNVAGLGIDEQEGGGGGDGAGSATGHRRARTTGYAVGPRVRPRRRRRRDGDDDDSDEATALTRTGTRSSTSSVAHETLTARLAARLQGAPARAGVSGATTVFSRDVSSRSQVSLTASALSRASSRASRRSSLAAPSTPPVSAAGAALPALLFTPADDPTLSDHLPIPGSSSSPSAPLHLTRSRSLSSAPASPALPPASSFGALIATDVLPAPGPPAYRPSSSTVQSTRRYAAGDGRPPALPFATPDRRARRNGGAAVDELPEGEGEGEGAWHWPGEKRRPLAGELLAADSATDPLPDVAPPSHSLAEGALPSVDRALYSAHIATDDKAVLARLRAQRDLTADAAGDATVASGSAGVPQPSAPHVLQDEEVDEDGFERFEVEGAPNASSPLALEDGDVEAQTSASFLPAPPQRVPQPSSSYRPRSTSPFFALPRPAAGSSKAALAAEYGAAENDDDADALPRYLAGGGAARDALELASAPPPPDEGSDDELEAEEEEEEEVVDVGIVRRNEGARKEEGVV